jgi:transcriptional regulator with XRE-family HTH domain
MIELGRKTPSLPMLERIAAALEIEASELFSMRNVPSASIKDLHKTILTDIEKAVSKVISERLKELDNLDKFPDEGKET